MASSSWSCFSRTISQVVVGIGIIRFKADDLLEMCRSLDEPALIRQHDSQVVVGRRHRRD